MAGYSVQGARKRPIISISLGVSMPNDSGLSWRDQLASIRDDVAQMEQSRAEEERLQLERSRDSLKERLRDDTPDGLRQQLQDIRKNCDRAARHFFPPEALETALRSVLDFEKRMLFYKGCQKEFDDLFTPQIVQTIARCLSDLENTKKGLNRQLGQWRQIQGILGNVGFRAKTEEDDRAVAQSAKTFNEQAHGITLSIPSDFFAGEDEGFHVITYGEDVIGYVKWWADRDVVTLALAPPGKVNFPKFVRGVLARAYQGPLADKKQGSVRVRLSMSREVKFFTDLGFVRKETISVSEWIFERPLA